MRTFYVFYKMRSLVSKVTMVTCFLGGRSAHIYDQLITWGDDQNQQSFNLSKIVVYCDCKHFWNVTRETGFCCKHLIGQLRRVIYLT